jgi:hypothetical protein
VNAGVFADDFDLGDGGCQAEGGVEEQLDHLDMQVHHKRGWRRIWYYEVRRDVVRSYFK